MLSRVAESLYWTARYVERAEDVTRLLDVNFHALLDGEVADRGASWQQLVSVLGDDGAYLEHHEDYAAESVSNWVLWHRARAPSRASSWPERTLDPEQISGEMWEAINNGLLVRGPGRCRRCTLSSASCATTRTCSRAPPTRRWSTARRTSSSASGCTSSGPRRARIVGARYPARPSTRTTVRPRALATCCARAAFESCVRRHGVVQARCGRQAGARLAAVGAALRQLPRRGRPDRSDNLTPRRLLGRLAATSSSRADRSGAGGARDPGCSWASTRSARP
jgi:hypothetical protein